MKTREEIEGMSEEDRWIATAEICFPEFSVFWDEGELRHFYSEGRSGPALNYLNSLDAMHEAEACFELVDNVMNRREYIKNLAQIVEVDTDMERWSFIQDFILLHATALQRNTAFLMVML